MQKYDASITKTFFKVAQCMIQKAETFMHMNE